LEAPPHIAPVAPFTWGWAVLAELIYTAMLCFVYLCCNCVLRNRGNKYFGVAYGFVYLAGGITPDTAPSLVWMFVSCSLILLSWLYAPFIFNPYEFVAESFREDARALCAFFLEKNGTHWLEWYNRTQLKAGHGLHKTLVDAAFFFLFFFVATWYVAVTLKVELLVNLFSEYDGWARLYGTMLLPPVFASAGFCIVVVCAETLFSCSSSVRRSVEAEVQRRRRRRADAERGEQAQEKEAVEWWAAPFRRNKDFGVSEPAASQEQAAGVADRLGCTFGVPLPFTAICVIAIDAMELFYTLSDIYHVGWWNALLSGVILKLALLSAAIMFGEGVLRSELFARATSIWAPLGLPLETWVTAHRMARDVFTSLLIFLPLSALVLLNSLNEVLCPACNVHHLCLYRDTGTQTRKEKVFELVDEEAPTWVAFGVLGAEPFGLQIPDIVAFYTEMLSQMGLWFPELKSLLARGRDPRRDVTEEDMHLHLADVTLASISSSPLAFFVAVWTSRK